MPAITKLKLRAGTQAQWVAAKKTQTLTSAILVGTTTIRYSATGGVHTLTKDQVVTITGFTVTSGNNPYNVTAKVISAVGTGYFEIELDEPTTGGTSSGTGTASVVELAVGEAAYEKDTNRLKIGNGTSLWENIDYVNRPIFYILNTQQGVTGTSSEQNLVDAKFPLKETSSYSFEIQAIILCSSTAAKNLKFGFEQTDMTAWADARYQWVYGTRTNGSTHYATEDKTVTGNSPATDGLILLGPDTDGTDDVIFFTIKGIIRTGAGSSHFQPRIKFNVTPGATSVLLSGSYIKLDLLGDSPFVSSINWVAN